jgi:hypothetical protein
MPVSNAASSRMVFRECVAITPTWEKVSEAFDTSRERICHRDWMMDSKARQARETRSQRNYPIVARRSFIAAE